MRKMIKAATILLSVVTAVLFPAQAVSGQFTIQQLRLSRKISRITATPVSEINLGAMGGHSVSDLYVTEKGTVYAILRETKYAYRIRVTPPNRAQSKEFACTGPAWEPRPTVNQIVADDTGNIYVAVEWPYGRGAILQLDARGRVVPKLTFPDFMPMTVGVDSEKRIWVAGWETQPGAPIAEQPKIPADAEQLRVYDQNARLLDTPVRNRKRVQYVTSLSALGNDVLYYAAGSNELYIFKNGTLAKKLDLGDIPRLGVPPEAGAEVEVLRGTTGVHQLETHIVLTGLYNYRWKDQDTGKRAGKNFVVLINPEDLTVSAELEAPQGFIARSNIRGELIYHLSGGKDQGGYTLTRTKIAF